jgi:hypothetical protein
MGKATVSLTDVSTFSMFFKGNEGPYGQYVPPTGQTKSGEKQKGTSWTETSKRVTTDLYRKHLQGEQGLGIVPIDENNNVRFCVIDIDVYPLNVKKYQSTINEYELPFLIFRSKSGGAHLYLFFKEDVKAEKLIPLMQQWRQLLGLPENTELFPKQARLRTSGSGNWINLPYFGSSRRMIDSNFNEVSLQEALMKIESSRVTLDELKLIFDGMPIHDGPPCLQSYYVMNDPGAYEMYLFNLAIYLRACRPNDWQEFVHKANDRLQDGLTQDRIDREVITAHERKTYSYRCTDEPICSRCDKLNCEGRKYGKGGDEISNFTFEELTQVLSDPPHYKWIVNGATMTFFSEQELRNQFKFSDYCMRNLHKVPNQVKPSKWVAILNKAFADISVEKMSLQDDISPGAMLAEYVYEFLFERARAKTRMQVSQLGRVYEDDSKQKLYFRKNELIKFITVTKNFRYFGTTEVQSRLKDWGAEAGNLYISKKINALRVWVISTPNAKKLGDNAYDDQELDFQDLIEDKEEF